MQRYYDFVIFSYVPEQSCTFMSPKATALNTVC